MDYCSTESELIETLDYLTLPVKRSASFVKHRNLCGDLPTGTGLIRDYRKKVSHKTQTSHSLHKCNDSIILNSTKEEIIQYYAFVSSTENTPSSKFLAYLQTEEIPTHKKDQSLIKVTVTPKKTKPQKPNVFTRRKHNTKHIHSTVSDEDHSIQTKNVYLVLSGQKREKHFNIKTTESARLLNDINKLNDDISLEQVKNVKQVIDSLNMDKKRKKGGAVNKEKKRTGSPSKTQVTAKKEGKRQDNKQRKKNDNETENEENNNQAKQAHSVVRITGQIGLGHNNQLMMRCGVEGREAPANMEFKSYPDSYFYKAETLLHTVTQGTQMDIEKTNARKEDTHRSKAPHYTENVACLCKNINDINQFNNELRNHNQAERRQSPLVVITVYQNDKRCENVTIYKQPGGSSPVNMYEGYTDVNCMQETNRFSAENKYSFQRKDIEFTDVLESKAQRRPRSASRMLGENELIIARDSYQPRSPRSQSQSTSSSQNIKRKEKKNKDKYKLLAKAKTTDPTRSPIKQSRRIPRNESPRSPRSESPRSPRNESPRSPRNETPKSPRNQSNNKNSIQSIKQQGFNKGITRKSEPKSLKGSKRTPNNRSPRSRSPSGLSASSRSPSTHSEQNTKPKDKENQRKKGIEAKQRPANEEKVPKPANMTSAGTNTDHTWTKRALVETFTKEVLGQMEKKKKNKSPKMNESQVTISIDGDTENYDMFFQQGRRTTDVRVRKTVKNASAGRGYQEINLDNNEKDQSLTNLLNSQNYWYELPTTEKSVVPEIKVRDSLEIGHKRQHTARLTLDDMNFTDMQAGVTDTDSFAPVKHYTGDDCRISDPVKRDKEIRHLLGIEKQTKKSPPIPNFKKPDPGHHFRHYQEATRMKKEVINQYIEAHKNQTHQINFQISRNRKSVGTQYELQYVPWDSQFSKKVIQHRDIQVFFSERKPIVLSRKQYYKVKRTIEHTISKQPKQKLAKAKCSAIAFSGFRKKEKIQTANCDRKPYINVSSYTNPMFLNKDTTVLFTADYQKKKESNRQSVSIGDVRVSYSETLNGSSTKVTVGSAPSHSIHTIFRGFRKPRTPNLGTSTCSFYSGNSNEFDETPVKHFKVPLEKPRKPFLRRLMSCLVLRASTTSGVKMAAAPKPKASYSSCTVDSYHISTSLAALEMSSSIYDTSVSFYSNHSIIPMNNKIKRGFFGSMRGLLTYGRT